MPATKASQQFDYLPIIKAQDVYPWNIALWPMSLENPNASKRLVVQIDPVSNEFDS
jgi:hypothetical protein